MQVRENGKKRRNIEGRGTPTRAGDLAGTPISVPKCQRLDFNHR